MSDVVYFDPTGTVSCKRDFPRARHICQVTVDTDSFDSLSIRFAFFFSLCHELIENQGIDRINYSFECAPILKSVMFRFIMN